MRAFYCVCGSHSIHGSYGGGSIVKRNKIVLTEADCERLQWLIDSSRAQCRRDIERVDELENELMRAIIVKSCTRSRGT